MENLITVMSSYVSVSPNAHRAALGLGMSFALQCTIASAYVLSLSAEFFLFLRSILESLRRFRRPAFSSLKKTNYFEKKNIKKSNLAVQLRLTKRQCQSKGPPMRPLP